MEGIVYGKEILQRHIGKKLTDVRLENDALCMTFSDGSGILLEDVGQSCCEERYMRTDDDLDCFVGANLVSVEVRDGGFTHGGGIHEVQFLIVTTSKGAFTMASHNEHNGYYGGFSLECSEVKEG